MLVLLQVALITGLSIAFLGLLIAGLSGLFLFGVVGAVLASFILLFGIAFKLLMLPFVLFLLIPAGIVWALLRRKRQPKATPDVIDI